MIDRESVRRFLVSIGHEAASNDQSSLCLTEAIVEALGEVTEGMIEAAGKCDQWTFDETADRRNIYRAMWAARFRGE